MTTRLGKEHLFFLTPESEFAPQFVTEPPIDILRVAFHEVESEAPEIRLTETDQTDPAGRYRLLVSTDDFSVDRALTAAWATSRSLLLYDQSAETWYLRGDTNNRSLGFDLSAAPVVISTGSTVELTLRAFGAPLLLNGTMVTVGASSWGFFGWASDTEPYNIVRHHKASNNTAIVELLRSSLTVTNGNDAGTGGASWTMFLQDTTGSASSGPVEQGMDVQCQLTGATGGSFTADMILRVAVSGAMTEFLRLDGSQDSVNLSAYLHSEVTAGITASTTQSQGQGALTAEVNEVATVANVNDTVTLPTAVVGRRVVVINNGANTLQIFPASGDNLGAGVDTATTLASGSNVVFLAFDGTNWESI